MKVHFQADGEESHENAYSAHTLSVPTLKSMQQKAVLEALAMQLTFGIVSRNKKKNKQTKSFKLFAFQWYKSEEF